jgi:D-amino-acid dehydrogenase
MVGISTALHLQKAGRSVALVDRRGPAEETSHGNAGLIQREGIVPYSFPRDLSKIIGTAFNRLPEAHLHWRALPWIAPFLARYWRESSPERVAATARAMRPLVERSLIEHEALMQEAGVADQLRRTGFIRVFRTARRLEEEIAKEESARRRYGTEYVLKDPDALAAMEPHLAQRLAGGLHMPQAASVASPGRVGQAYADLFVQLGGTLVQADAFGLSPGSEAWTLPAARLRARDVVLALGPWTASFAARLGFRLPMGFKRGYHMRYALAATGVQLHHPLLDAEKGYLITPEDDAIRLTTSAEFARLEAAPTPVQLTRSEPVARDLFPLGPRLLDAPWMGARPCFPDLVPMIGPVPGHPRLWVNTGHHHLGFTLGPVSGRLLSAMITGETGFTDPKPYRADRFG